MAIKRILLPLADLEDFKPVAEAAFLVGRLHQAQVRGLLIQRAELDVPFRGEYVDPEAMQRLVESARTEREAVNRRGQDLFEQIADQHRTVEAAFSAVGGYIAEHSAHAARLADISILPGNGREDEHQRELRDATLFRSGRPILVVPPEGVQEAQFRRVVIAWKESVEAARAVAAAQPFLLHADEVHLVTVPEGHDAVSSLQDVEQYLQLHYAEVQSEFLMRETGAEIGDILQDKAAELNGAVLVMGAYSHWRWSEQLFGGVTASALRRARVPIVMAR